MARDNTRNLQLNKPGLFSPSVVRTLRQGRPPQTLTFGKQDNILSGTNIGSTSSFKYSVDGSGLKSTQQLNIDWSFFENHTFFNSAQVKTNVALDRIFNEFPFDGTKEEFEVFFESLTGFEKWVYDQFPKNKGYLFFSGTQPAEGPGGTFVRTKDIKGASFPTVAKTLRGNTAINPGLKSMTVEFHLYVPSGSASSGSVILDKHSDNGAGNVQGFYTALEPTGSNVSGSVSFFVLSGALSDKVTIDVDKGKWNHLAWVWNRTPGNNSVVGYRNFKVYSSSSSGFELGNIVSDSADLLIGSGSALTSGSLFTATEASFSGALDELRIWHTPRTQKELELFGKKAVFADENLKLYYKFNEPSGSSSKIVLDHSSNALHGNLSMDGVTFKVRNVPTGSVAGKSPMTFEKLADTPVLFPTHPDILSLQTKLLTSASRYDDINPNLITKLIPSHYLIEGQQKDALESELGEIVEGLQGGSDPRTAELGATQVLLLLLYTWAKFFDELKLYTQAFSSLDAVDYDTEDTTPDQFLQLLARKEGIDLPPLFEGSSIEQYIDAENIQSQISTNDINLQAIRNQIWRRILINLQDVMRSKGTIHSVKSFIRSAGVNPDNNFRIREYGGPTRRPLSFVRDKRSEISTLLDFVSGGLAQSSFLSASRKSEPGFPEPVGTAADGLLTSGSWTYEATYRLDPSLPQGASQSLVRMETTGSNAAVVTNLVSVKGDYTTLFYQGFSGNMVTVPITGADLFDGDKWYVSFGRRRNDEFNSEVSSSYFLRLAKSNFGEIISRKSGSAFHDDQVLLANVWEELNVGSQPSGSFIVVGSASLDNASGFMNTGGGVTDVTAFTGKVGHVRFYSKYLTEKEWPEHVRNYRSVGVQDPLKNFNFVTTPTGSWQRLRLDVSTDQPVTKSDASGEILLTDFSQNGLGMTGSSFPATSSIIKPERFYFSYISPKFDQAATTEKVRVRSFQSFENVQDTPWASVAPVHEVEPSEEPTDNTRFTIDFSVVDALDQDIISMFSTLDALDNAIGDPSLMFSPDYPSLEDLRDIYFDKLVDKMNLKRFFEFFKWFDTNIGTFVEQLIPRKTKYFGTNFVIESHMLERPKVEYQFSDIYLGDNERHKLKDTILLQLITGDFSRY